MKTIMNSKMLKVFLLVAIFATTQATAVSAQETAAATSEVSFIYSSGAMMEIGDTVMIHKDSLRYLTGERMSKWVYGVPHQIRQLGTKTKPTGVLLRGIYSWLSQGSLIPLNADKTQEAMDAKRAAEEAARLAAEEAARLAAEEAARLAAEEAARLAALEEEVVEEVVELDTVPAPQPYQLDRFTVGVRGGLASLLPKSTPAIGATWGFDVLLDLQYAHYWAKADDKVALGILTGLSLGYMQNQKPLKDIVEDYTYLLPSGAAETQYHITVDEIATMNRQLQLEVPVMFSMIAPMGIFVNAGPKFILPVYTPYNQTVKGTTITATDVPFGVPMVDNPVMGRMDKEYTQKGMNEHQFDLTIALGAEVGYEHKLESGHSVSVGIYADYGLYSTYKNKTDGHIISVAHPLETGTVGQVTVNSVNNAYINKLGYLDAGVKVAFHLNWKK